MIILEMRIVNSHVIIDIIGMALRVVLQVLSLSDRLFGHLRLQTTPTMRMQQVGVLIIVENDRINSECRHKRRLMQLGV